MKRSALILMFVVLAGGTAMAQEINYDKIIIRADSLPNELEERLVQLAWQHYPENKALQVKYRQTEEEVRLEKRSWMDNLNFNYQYNVQGNVATQTMVALPRYGTGITLNMASIFNLPLRVKIKVRDKEIAEQGILKQKLFIRSTTLKLFETYHIQMDIVRSLTQAVEDIRTLTVINKKGFENGSIPADEYTRSLTTFGQLVQQQKTAEMNMTVARLSLEEVIGVKLEEVEKEFNQN